MLHLTLPLALALHFPFKEVGSEKLYLSEVTSLVAGAPVFVGRADGIGHEAGLFRG